MTGPKFILLIGWPLSLTVERAYASSKISKKKGLLTHPHSKA